LAGARARIVSIAHHDSGVRLVTLTLAAPFPFLAGQYLNVVHPGGARIPMSIASPPDRLPQLELHFRPLPGVPDAALMNELLAEWPDTSRELQLDGPFGEVCFDGPCDKDVLLIAGGSGIAQCLSIIEHLRAAGQTHRVRLVWSVTHASQLYRDAALRDFADWLDYVAVVDSPGGENGAIRWLRREIPRRAGRVVVSGGPGFVYAVADALNELTEDPADTSIESDVFSYAPR
jgi:CDP-4-dehydro-6-deoxyglucose reductase, E3